MLLDPPENEYLGKCWGGKYHASVQFAMHAQNNAPLGNQSLNSIFSESEFSSERASCAESFRFDLLSYLAEIRFFDIFWAAEHSKILNFDLQQRGNGRFQ